MNTVTARLRARMPRVSTAVLVGVVVRIAWIVAARPHLGGYSTDEASYLRLATELGDFRLPTIGGHPTAFFSPGYPALLALPVTIGGWVGISAQTTALAINLGLAALTIVLVGRLAERAGGSAEVGAWLWALYPAGVLMTTHVMAENLFAPVSAAILWWLSSMLVGNERVEAHRLPGTEAAEQRRPHDLWRPAWTFLLGAAIGGSILVRSSGLGLAVLAAAAVAAARWRGEQRPLAERLRRASLPMMWGVLGVSVVCAPWALRNRLDVGITTPLPTNNLTGLCVGNWDGATGAWKETPATLERCLRHSPWDNSEIIAPLDRPEGFEMSYPDEQLWYRTVSDETLGWIVDNPGRQPGLVTERARRALLSDFDPHYQPETGWFSVGAGRSAIRVTTDVGYWLLVAAAVAVWARRPGVAGRPETGRVRLLVLAAAVALTIPSLIGVAYPMFKYPAMVPVVAAAASVPLLAPPRRQRPGQ